MVRFLLIGLLALGNVLVWSLPTPHGLTVSFLDVGQGDSIFIQGPTGIQMLVDAGPPDQSALRELGAVMPFFDRSLDAVVETHPDQDHIGGIPDVFARYSVQTFLEPGIANDTGAAKAVVNTVQNAHAKDVIARRGMRLLLGAGAYADVLYPTDHDIATIKDTNSGSVVLHVVYGKTSFLLTGDLPQKQELMLTTTYASSLQSDVLKAAHHGSKNSSAPEFVRAVNPTYGVFSRGCNNRYGHPAPEVVQLFVNLKISTFDTCTDGRVTFQSDGVHLTRR